MIQMISGLNSFANQQKYSIYLHMIGNLIFIWHIQGARVGAQVKNLYLPIQLDYICLTKIEIQGQFSKINFSNSNS